MEIRLTFQERLKDLRTERGMTLSDLEKATGISRSSLGKYESDDCKEVSHASIVTLAKYYGVTSDYLLGLSENKNPANADLSDLHLQDDVIAILKGGKLNNRLLCELIRHEGFRRFLTDAEIYVDGLAEMQIRNLNIGVDTVRMQIEDRFSPDKEELYRRALEAAHIDEGRYFAGIIHEDLDGILADIREAHKHDRLSAPEENPAAEFGKDIAEITKGEGEKNEAAMKAAAKMFGLNKEDLSDEDWAAFVRIIQAVERKNGGKGRKKSKRYPIN